MRVSAVQLLSESVEISYPENGMKVNSCSCVLVLVVMHNVKLGLSEVICHWL